MTKRKEAAFLKKSGAKNFYLLWATVVETAKV
jgi:hypothetical protein